MRHSSEARRLLRELNAELASASKHTGRSLVWTPQDRAVLELIAYTVDRRVDLAADYAVAECTARRVKISAELRLLEGSLSRLLKQVQTDIPAPESLRTVKARAAARARWDRDATG